MRGTGEGDGFRFFRCFLRVWGVIGCWGIWQGGSDGGRGLGGAERGCGEQKKGCKAELGASHGHRKVGRRMECNPLLEATIARACDDGQDSGAA